MNSYTPAEKQLMLFLRFTAFVHFALTLAGAVLIYVQQGASGSSLTQTPLDTNAFASMGLLGLLAWLASADVRRFRRMIWVLVAGFALDVAGLVVMSLSPRGYDGSPLIPIIWSVFFGLVLVLLLQRAPAAPAPWLPWLPDKALTRPEKIARVVCIVVGILSLGGGLLHYGFAWSDAAGALPALFAPSLLVNGSALKLLLMGLCLLVAARDVRRWRDFITVFILGNVITLLLVIAAHFGMNRAGAVMIPEVGLSSRALMLGALAVDVLVVVGFTLLRLWMDKTLLDHIRFFAPLEFRALEAVAETLVEGGDMEQTSPEQIVLRTDDYLSSFPSRRLFLARLAVIGLEFLPLLSFKPPISFLNPQARREFIDRHFKQDIVAKRGIYGLLERLRLHYVIDLIEGMMRFNMQLSYMGYYSNPEVQKSIGYSRFSEREAGKKAKPARRYPALTVTTPQTLRQRGIDTLTADVLIIGSGAAGGILAERLADAGREVLILEKGPYVHPDNFSEDEVEQISRLYSDGALQISQSLRFTVLQGSCVGGTTVVNNAVCFDTPDSVLEEWNHPLGANAGIDLPAFRAAQKAVRERMQIRSIKESTTSRPWEEVLNPGDRVVARGIEALRSMKQNSMEYEVIEANILDCLGCGYCNIGCKYGRKLSMLDEVLPAAQQKHGEKFRIVSEAEVTRLVGNGGHITEVEARLRDGRRLTIRPKTVILSAGTIASSWLLMQSGIGRGELPVGQHLAFNMGSPLHGLWDETLDSFAGLQIAHYMRPQNGAGFVYETWYNPPVAQALAMPGWLDTHFQNMQQYNKIAGVGVLVGTESNAHLRPALILRGQPDIVYTPSERDMTRLVDALCSLGEIMFEGGAKAIFASTRHYHSYAGKAVFTAQDAVTFADDLKKLVKDERDILLGTGHPQGGNRISKLRGKDGRAGGVVNPQFQVYGYDNLYVCDASVFPGATTVNPQLSVMTMAHYAADIIR